MITARQIVTDVLHRSRTREAFVGELIEECVTGVAVSPQDRRFITQLVYGVIRRRGTLDALIKPFIRIPFHAVQPRVWDVLHIGAFQLTYLTHVPKHAAVNETVELAAHVGAARAKGFINSVMRRVAELVTDEFTDTAGPDTVPMDLPSAGAPVSDVASANPGRQQPGASRDRLTHARYRKLTQPVLPDPVAQPDEYFAAAFSFPKWLVDRWLERYGREECLRLGFWFNAPPPLWIRTNKLHNDRETYRLRLAAGLIEAATGEHPQSLRLFENHSIRDLPGYTDGDFSVQDHSSMLVASALNVQPGMRILDLCAAPGGKTTHLAELMDNRGVVTACDIDGHRLDSVTNLAQRLRIKGIKTILLPEGGELPPGPFDAALVDVPCSNTGVMGRRPEVRWRLQPTEFQYLVRLQTRLLIEAAERVKSGGTIVYSTCSIEPDENEGVVKAVCSGMRSVKFEAEHHAIPGQPSDGGYWARLRKQ